MNFQQLRSVREAVRRGFNLTEVAQTLNTSQPGVSRQIRELEDELGIELFVRVGKRLTGLTEPGSHVLPIIERILLNSHNLRKAGQEYVAPRSGQLSVAGLPISCTEPSCTRQVFTRSNRLCAWALPSALWWRNTISLRLAISPRAAERSWSNIWVSACHSSSRSASEKPVPLAGWLASGAETKPCTR